MPFYPLDKIKHLHEAYSRPFNVAGQQLLLVHSNGISYIVNNRCPQHECLLHEGVVRDGKIYCQHRGDYFDLTSGKPGGQSSACRSLTQYQVQLEQDVIGVFL